MQKNKKTVFLSLLFMVIAAIGGGLHYRHTHSSARLGISLNGTDDGTMAALHAEQGVEMAADMLNEKGGVLGKPVQLISMNNKGTATGAATAMEDLHLRHVAAVIGPLREDLIDASVLVAESQHIALISPIATNRAWSCSAETGKPYNHVFQMALPPEREGAAMANFAATVLHKSKSLIICDNKNTASAEAAEAYAAFMNQDAPIADTATVTPENIVFHLQSAPYDSVYLPLPADTAAAYVSAVRNGTLSVPVLGSSLWSEDDMADLLPLPYLNNLFFTDQYINDATYAPGETFAERYYEKYGTIPDKYAALSFDAAMLVAAAAEESASLNSADIAAALTKISNYNGATGTISVRADHSPDRKVHILTFWQGSAALLCRLAP